MIFAIRAAVRARRSAPPRMAHERCSVRLAPASVRTLITTRYTKEHEAVAYDDETGVGIVSITEHAQDSLGDVVFVELPAVSAKVGRGEQIGAVESVKAASDIFAPVSGEVVQVNERLNGEPGLLNRAPEGDGWLCKIQLSDPIEIDKLLTAEGYKEICDSA